MLCDNCKKQLEEFELVKIKKLDYKKMRDVIDKLEIVCIFVVIGLFLGVLFGLYGLTTEYEKLPSIGYAIDGILFSLCSIIILIKIDKSMKILSNINYIDVE